jgi:predicted amidohydrolase
MKNTLRISLVQTNTIWEDIKGNLENLSVKMNDIDNDTDLIILPELFSTGFTMQAKGVAESMTGQSVQWMLQQASDKNCLVTGSVLIEEKNHFYNRLIVAFPGGALKFYDKRHLFSFAGEDKVFKAGHERLIFEYKGFKICPLICYDLRFPVWSRNTADFDLLIYVANWPDARMLAWDTLLKARAIENLCFVAAVNRVGIDDNNLVYTGHSGLFDAMGASLLTLEPAKELIQSYSVDKTHLQEVRNKFRFLEDRDEFEIK